MKTLREEQRLRVFENTEMRKIFGPKRDEVTRLQISFYDLHSSSNIIRVIKPRRMTWAGYVAFMWGKEKCILDFGGETSGKDTTWKT